MVNIFGGTADPLLGSEQSYLSDKYLMDIERAKQSLEQRKQAIVQARQQIAAQPQSQSQPLQQQSQTPIWDEIDSIVQNLSDKEYELIMGNEEFIESSNAVSAILNAHYMRMMRPIVEQSEEGRNALEKHLTLVKRLRKSASAEVDREIADFKEYTEKYSDMPYSEYLKMKRQHVKPKKG